MANQTCATRRIEELKSSGAIDASEHHSQPSRDTPNADPTKCIDNTRFIGQKDVRLEAAIEARISNDGGIKIRRSTDPKQPPVLALEMILTASPEYFRPTTPNAVRGMATG